MINKQPSGFTNLLNNVRPTTQFKRFLLPAEIIKQLLGSKKYMHRRNHLKSSFQPHPTY